MGQNRKGKWGGVLGFAATVPLLKTILFRISYGTANSLQQKNNIPIAELQNYGNIGALLP